MASKRYLELLEEMEQLHIKKNAGYAGHDPDAWANFRMSEAVGVSAFLGCLVRMSDKYIRVTNLVKDPALDRVGESIKDTLFDLAAYSLIAICLLEEQEQQKKRQCSHIPADEPYVCANCLDMVMPNPRTAT